MHHLIHRGQMKSITVHGIDQKMEKLIQERAKSAGTSVNRIVKELLAKALPTPMLAF
jgi:predicted HicB family RNase H-like nuclease